MDKSPLSMRPVCGLLYQFWTIDHDDDDDDDDGCGAMDGMNDWQGKLKYSEETCPNAALSTMDPI
jgi:hypothetical protein